MPMPFPPPEYVAGLRYHLDGMVTTGRECLAEGDRIEEVVKELYDHFVDPQFLMPESMVMSPEFHIHVLATLISLAIGELSKPPLPEIKL